MQNREYTIPKIFDRNKVRIHRDRVSSVFLNYDFLFKYYSEDLLERIEFFKDSMDDPGVILEISARNGALSSKLSSMFKSSMIISSDLSREMLAFNPTNVKIVIDEENLPFESGTIGIVISNLAMHWVNDVPGVLCQIYNVLKPGGLFIANFFGGKTLSALKKMFLQAEVNLGLKVHSHISPMIVSDILPELMKRAEFDSQITDTNISKIRYSSVFELMRDLKYMGESHSMFGCENYPLTRSTLKELNKIVPEEFEEEFEIITITGRKLVKL
jgi:NADH dehydrogenase [ubiquinone] 1 alpha subcomplex assembly factor 5